MQEHLFEPGSHWERCYQHFLLSLRTPNTVSRYGLILRHFFSGVEKSPELVTRSDVESFIHSSMSSARSSGKPLAPSAGTVNFRLSAIRSFFGYSATYTVQNAEGVLQPLLRSSNPTFGIKHRKRGTTHRTISPEDLKRLFDAIPLTGVGHIRNRALLLFYLYSGRRREEVIALRWGDISETTFVDEHGHTRNAYRYRYKQSKGKEGYAYAELAQPVYDQITWYLEASGRMDTIQPGDALFVGHGNRNTLHSAHPLRGASVLRILKTYAQDAGLDAGAICVHLLRHTSAQRRYAGGQDILSLMNALGHVSLSNTWIYLQSLTVQDDNAIPSLESSFQGLIEP